MSVQSPISRPRRPGNLIDPQQQGEYPVLLGDALRTSGHNDGIFLNLRYNWKSRKASSKSGMTLTERQTEEGSKYFLKLDGQANKDKQYTYLGHARDSTISSDSSGGNSNTSLALVYNASKSAFVLEPLSASFDFNITSAPELTRQEIKAYAQLGTTNQTSKLSDDKSPLPRSNAPSDSDSEPDAANPYDYRHFLTEARGAAAKGARSGAGGGRTPLTGSRSPMPGARTPLLGSTSPVPGASRFHSSASNALTPQFHATSGPSQNQRKRKVDPPAASPPKPKPKIQASGRKHATSSSSESKRPQLSAERIIDSDEEVDPSVLVPVTSQSPHRKVLSTMNSNTGRPSSPHVLVSDADAELEIDLGSPPATPGRKKLGVDPSAFHRGGRNTPRIGEYRSPQIERGLGRIGARDNDNNNYNEDVEMEDADVEALELGSPRMESKLDEPEEQDDEDGLAAELEAALEEVEEDDDDDQPMGLGITTAGAGRVEEESEVSEEE